MDSVARSRLRQARQRAQLSLRELGRRTGVSASMLSQIEHGKSEPSVSTLYALVSALSLSLDELLSGEEQRPSAGVALSARPLRPSPIVTAEERAVLNMDTGVRWERLTREADALADALLVTYDPGSRSSSSGGLMTHSGTEYAYLIKGELTVQLGFDHFTLHAGESLSFDSAQPHLYVNHGTEPAVGIWHVVGRYQTASGDSWGRIVGRPPTSAVEVLETFGQL